MWPNLILPARGNRTTTLVAEIGTTTIADCRSFWSPRLLYCSLPGPSEVDWNTTATDVRHGGLHGKRTRSEGNRKGDRPFWQQRGWVETVPPNLRANLEITRKTTTINRPNTFYRTGEKERLFHNRGGNTARLTAKYRGGRPSEH